MSITERSDMLASLHKVRADLGVLFSQSQAARAVTVGINVQGAQNLISEAIAEFQPDPTEIFKQEFPTPKF